MRRESSGRAGSEADWAGRHANRRMRVHVVLIGLMGSGKSHGRPGPRNAPSTVRFSTTTPCWNDEPDGVRVTSRPQTASTASTRLKAEVLADALADAQPAVIAAAAAAPVEACRVAGTWSCISRTTGDAGATLRVAGDDYRPLLERRDACCEASTKAAIPYRATATLVVDATQSPAAIVDEIMRWLAAGRT